ncbi:group II intron reverse transcriptase/maturase [Teredinibacter turnerae]|uniref:group II intron reverse transcriptase/maturase n=1 Tax=Teredinibacter turnerae TaxID=2426 RepID=UPI0018AD4C98|nr:group II intron reverse transcriptase/maturase [Teredinibacter turnerae]
MSDSATGHRAGTQAMSPLMRVREAARKDKTEVFTALFHHLSQELLSSSFRQLKRSSAKGVDGVFWQAFQESLSSNIEQLHKEIQSGQYKPSPSRRVQIPKADGTARLLSIQCVRDNVVQQATSELHNQIYETEFLVFSYGFRPGRSQHDALDALTFGLQKRKVNWLLDLDIQKFFDSVEHDWLIEMVRHRIKDGRLINLIIKWIQVGRVNEKGKREPSHRGIPEGAVIFPLLANIHLHYVFDLWGNQWRKCKAKGTVLLIRFADDAVFCFQYKSDADKFVSNLRTRLEQFGLTQHPDKTRLLRLGRFARKQSMEKESIKVASFVFLGFTHFCTIKRNGEFQVGRKTAKLNSQIQAFQQELRKRFHRPVRETAQWIASVLRGHINYFGVPGNAKSLIRLHEEVSRRWLKMLRRRSQRSKITWSVFGRWVKCCLPKVRIVHQYPEKRFYAKYLR